MAPERTPEDGLEQLRAARERRRREEAEDVGQAGWYPSWRHDTLEFEAITAELADIDHEVVQGTVVRPFTGRTRRHMRGWALGTGLMLLGVVALSGLAARSEGTPGHQRTPSSVIASSHAQPPMTAPAGPAGAGRPHSPVGAPRREGGPPPGPPPAP